VAIGLGVGQGLHGQVSASADLVLHDDRLARERSQALGDVAHPHIGAAAGGKPAIHMNFMLRELLRQGWAAECQEQSEG
jgi:hypothetical protein